MESLQFSSKSPPNTIIFRHIINKKQFAVCVFYHILMDFFYQILHIDHRFQLTEHILRSKRKTNIKCFHTNLHHLSMMPKDVTNVKKRCRPSVRPSSSTITATRLNLNWLWKPFFLKSKFWGQAVPLLVKFSDKNYF